MAAWRGLADFEPGRDKAFVSRLLANRRAVRVCLVCEERVGSAWGIRTPDLRLERAVSLAARRMRHSQMGAA